VDQKERYRGSLLGLACGDALGAPVESRPRGSFEPVSDMSGGCLRPGEWTDDTSMALCLAESLIELKGFDPADQMKRYLRWFREGHLSSTGRCFGIGRTTRGSLLAFEKSGDPFSGPIHATSAGNGSIMRLAPVPLFFAANSGKAIEMSGESSRTTHGATAAIDACRYMGALIVGALSGIGKEDLLRARFSPVPKYWDEHPLAPEIDEVACGSFKKRNPPQIRGTAYVVDSLEAALWAFYHSDSFEDGCLAAVNLGDDSDTTGAVFGQIAGAFHGEEQIPERWLSRLAHRELIESFADRLHDLAQCPV